MNYIRMNERIQHPIYFLIYLIGAFLFVSFFYIIIFWNGGNIFASTCTSAQTGDWNVTSTWIGCGDLLPQVGDIVVIVSGHTVTIPSGYTINQVVDINVQGTLNQNGTNTQTITGTLTIENGAYVGHGDNSTIQANEFNFIVGNLDIQSGGNLSVDLAGFDGGYYDTALAEENNWGKGYGDGKGIAVYGEAGGGGAYGGNGGYGTSGGAGGSFYNLEQTPISIGSGGAGAYQSQGGYGGGYVKIVISSGGTATVAGNISANGSGGVSVDADNHAGGGSGGGIWIDFTSGGTFAGGGILSANGGTAETSGDGGSKDGGSGAGGRIAVIGYTTTTFSGTISVAGGNIVDWSSGLDVPGAPSSAHGYSGSIALSVMYANVEPATLYTGQTGTAISTFMTTQDLPSDGFIMIDFGEGFDVSGGGVGDATCSSMDGTFFASVSGQGIVIYRLGGTTASAGSHTCTIANVVNPSSAGSTGTYTIRTFNGLTGGYKLLDINDSVSADMITVAPIAPVASGLELIASHDGTGDVTIGVTLDDDNDDALNMKIEAKSGTCASYSGQTTTTLSSTVISTFGTLSVDNDEANGYQVSSIPTISGANTVTTTWHSATDFASADGTYCVFVTPYDGTDTGTVVSSTIILDNVNPGTPGAFTINTTSTNQVIFDFGAQSSDTNFNEYVVAWNASTTEPIINLSDGETTSSTVSALGVVDYDSESSVTVTGLATSTQYSFNIYAGDTYGNYVSSTNALTFFTLATPPGAPSVSASSSSIITLTLDNGTNSSIAEYSICTSSNGSSCATNGYVQLDGSLGASAVWDEYDTLGGATGFDIIGLSANTQYIFLTYARNGDYVETSTSVSSSAYTSASIPTSLSAIADSDTQVTLTWTGDGTSYTISDTLSDIASGETSSSHSVTGLICNTTYTFKVKALNGDGIASLYSDTITVTTNACPSGSAPAPIPPQIDPVIVLENLDEFSIDIDNAGSITEAEKKQHQVDGDIITTAIPIGKGFLFDSADTVHGLVVRGVSGN